MTRFAKRSASTRIHTTDPASPPEAALISACDCIAGAHGAPGLPGDAEDYERDREAYEGIGDRQADGDHGGAGDDGEAGVGVGAGVGPVGDERGAVEALSGAGADVRGDPVADEAERAGGGERAKRFGGARGHEPIDP